MGIYLANPKTDKVTIMDECDNFKFAASGMQGWRTSNEDAHITEMNLTEQISLFGVFDGHGGKEVSNIAKKYFAEELLKTPEFKEGNYGAALTKTFLRMDQILDEPEVKAFIKELKSNDDSNDQGYDEITSGSTATVCLMNGNELTIANAGDSRCCIIRDSNSNYEQLTIDHKPDDDKEKNRVINAGGSVYDGRINGNLNLSRAIGDLEYKKNKDLKTDEQLIIAHPDIFTYTLKKEDKCILIGCDGVWETWSLQQISEYLLNCLRENVDPKKIIEDFLDNILAKDSYSGIGCDNMTAILIILKQ